MMLNAALDMVNEIEVQTEGLILEINDKSEHISVDLKMSGGVITVKGEDLETGSHVILNFHADVGGKKKSVEVMCEVTRADESEAKLKVLNVRSVK